MRAYLEGLEPRQRDVLRILGGLLFTAGALALFVRKSSHSQWGDFGRLLVLLVPCAVLFLLGLRAAAERPATAQSVLLVLAVILVPLTLFQFLALVNGNANDSLNAAWIFGLTGALALYAALTADVVYTALLAAISLLIAWLSVWDKILDHPSETTFRWLLVVIAVGFVVTAVALERRSLRQATDFVTGAGIAAVAAGVLGLFTLSAHYVARVLSGAFGGAAVVRGGARQHQEWDVFLLVIALALIWYGTRRAARGPTYVGGLGLLAFIVSVGTEVVALFSGSHPSGSLVGWPLLLLLVGGAGLALGFATLAPPRPPPSASSQPTSPPD